MSRQMIKSFKEINECGFMMLFSSHFAKIFQCPEEQIKKRLILLFNASSKWKKFKTGFLFTFIILDQHLTSKTGRGHETNHRGFSSFWVRDV